MPKKWKQKRLEIHDAKPEILNRNLNCMMFMKFIKVRYHILRCNLVAEE